MRTRCIATLVLVAGLLAAARPASAQDADALIAHGVQLRQQGQDEAALGEFRHAYEMGHGAHALGQIALAEQALGRWVDAEHDLVTAIAMGSDPWIVRNRATLDRALEIIRTHLGSVDVHANVDGATVSVNGHEVGRLPLAAPARVENGTVAIEVRAPGYITARRVIEVTGGGNYREGFNLIPGTDTSAASATHTAAPTGSSPSGTEPATTSTQSSPTPETANASGTEQPAQPESTASAPGAGNGRRSLGLGVLAGGGVVVLGAIGAHIWWQERVGVYNDNSQCFYGALTRSQRCGAVLDNANTAETVMIVGYIVGGVALAAGAVLYLTAPNGTSDHHARLGCGPGPGDVGISCAARF